MHVAIWKDGVWDERGLDTTAPSKVHCPQAGVCYEVYQNLRERKSQVVRLEKGVESHRVSLDRWVLEMAGNRYGQSRYGNLYLATDSGLYVLEGATHGLVGPIKTTGRVWERPSMGSPEPPNSVRTKPNPLRALLRRTWDLLGRVR